jgi:uncharacterized Tic20 family protein
MSTTSTQPPLSEQDERLMAGLSHLLGWMVALIIWAIQRERSEFVRFQTLQAIAFDVVMIAVIFVLTFCSMCAMFALPLAGVGMAGMGAAAGSEEAAAAGGVLAITLATAVSFLPFCLMMPVMLVMLGGHIVAAVQTFSGKDFRYPWLGEWLEKRLAK